MSVASSRRRATSPVDGVPPGYSLVICEKPDAARRVAGALAAGPVQTLDAGRSSAFYLDGRDGKRYVVCSAAGHLYGVSETVRDRNVYPALDLEWFPLEEVDRKASRFSRGRISAIRKLSRGASEFVNACDFDVEGETIGFNILRYACGGKEGFSRRAKFSDLTAETIVDAFANARSGSKRGMARAGRLRHAVDFAWGVNLSRALSGVIQGGRGFHVLSIGRVQGPALNFAVQRAVEVMAFVPVPHWTVEGWFRKEGVAFVARHVRSPLARMEEASVVKRECAAREGTVSRVSRREETRRPPPPFNLGDLQKQAFRVLGYSPSKTLQIAERLYLGAMISYPRTESQKLPRLDFAGLLTRLGQIPGYSGAVSEILSRGRLDPAEGRKSDPAHPAIYPTGHFPKRQPSTEELKLFDMVARRFLACFGRDASVEVVEAEIRVGDHSFTAEASRTLVPGWTGFAAAESGSSPVSSLREGERVVVDDVLVDERLGRAPERYDEGTLLEKMERERLGTKATRGETISTLVGRGYLERRTLVPTELGFSLVEAMSAYCPQIISTGLTREIEEHLEEMANSDGSGDGFFEEAMSALLAQLFEVRRNEAEIAEVIGGSQETEARARTVLGRCPVCKQGELWVVRSRKTGKRFVGCTGYSSGCRASSPLPQRGALSPSAVPCAACGWPVVWVGSGRRRWKSCVNDRCPRRVNVYSMKRRAAP